MKHIIGSMIFLVGLGLGASEVPSDGLVLNEGYWYLAQDGDQHGPVIPTRIVVRRKNGGIVSRASLAQWGYEGVLKVHGPIVEQFYVLHTDLARSFTLFAELSADPSYDLVEYDVVAFYSGEPEGEPPTNDPEIIYQDNLLFHEVVAAWDETTGISSVIVGCIDSGVEISHEDLEKNIWVNPDEDRNGNGIPDFEPFPVGDLDGQDNDDNGFVDDLVGWNFELNNNRPDDFENGHGTLTAGVMTADTNNTLGVAGIAGGWGADKGASLLSVRLEENPLSSGSTSALSVLRGIEYAAVSGARLLNLSLGWQPQVRAFEEGLLVLLDRHDLIICAASGNNPCPDVEINYPARYRETIAVGRAVSSGRIPGAGYQIGPEMDVVALYGVLSTMENNQYGLYGGTSSSAAEVSGIIALMLSLNEDLPRKKAQFILGATAKKQEPGMGDLYYHCAFGYGTVDAKAAVAEVAGLAKPAIEDHVTLVTAQGVGVVRAYESIVTGGGFSVGGGSNVVLHSGGTIVLGHGTSIDSGASFRADVGYHEFCEPISISSCFDKE